MFISLAELYLSFDLFSILRSTIRWVWGLSSPCVKWISCICHVNNKHSNSLSNYLSLVVRKLTFLASIYNNLYMIPIIKLHVMLNIFWMVNLIFYSLCLCFIGQKSVKNVSVKKKKKLALATVYQRMYCPAMMKCSNPKILKNEVMLYSYWFKNSASFFTKVKHCKHRYKPLKNQF